MKNIFLVALLFIEFGAFAQDDVSVEGNTVSMKETAPVWPGCEASEDTKSCFNSMLMKHIKENYKYPKNENGEYKVKDGRANNINGTADLFCCNIGNPGECFLTPS